jgi:hypothetical protein
MPSKSLANITDMNAIANVYQSVMLAVNRLAGLETRFRPERFVFDVQISDGKLCLFIRLDSLRCMVSAGKNNKYKYVRGI